MDEHSVRRKRNSPTSLRQIGAFTYATKGGYERAYVSFDPFPLLLCVHSGRRARLGRYAPLHPKASVFKLSTQTTATDELQSPRPTTRSRLLRAEAEVRHAYG
jgi:hypothetical protein